MLNPLADLRKLQKAFNNISFSFSKATGEGDRDKKTSSVRYFERLKMQYNNLNYLWLDTLKRIMNHGDELDSRAGKTKEILGFQAILLNPLNNILLGFKERKFSLNYGCAELLWYLSGSNKIDMISAYAPSYKNFAENGIAFGAYGYRWGHNPGFAEENAAFFHPNGNNQLEAIIFLLKKKSNTRQAIMTMWDSGDLIHAIAGSHKDLPCTISLHFLVRENKLHLIATMRSNDCWLGLPYDVFCFTTLQHLIATECNLQLGTYIHQAGSEHIYEKNFEKINKILGKGRSLEHPYFGGAHIPVPDNHRFSLQYNIELALNFEKEIRKTCHSYKDFNDLLERGLYPMDNMFQDLVVGTATKWVKPHPQHFYNSLFQEYQRQNLEK